MSVYLDRYRYPYASRKMAGADAEDPGKNEYPAGADPDRKSHCPFGELAEINLDAVAEIIYNTRDSISCPLLILKEGFYYDYRFA